MSTRIIITNHADERLKERLGLPKSARHSTAQRAFDEGISHSKARGRLRKYLDGLFLMREAANNLRVHGRHVFAFHDRILITVLHLPHDLEGAARKSLQPK